jgi:hypothetical protein
VFFSSDHSESQSTGYSTFGTGFGSVANEIIFLSVNRTGSMPPAAADVQTGAAITVIGSNDLSVYGAGLIQGFTLTTGRDIVFVGINSEYPIHLKNCALVFTGTSVHAGITSGWNQQRLLLENTTIQVGTTSMVPFKPTNAMVIDWINTPPSAIQGASRIRTPQHRQPPAAKAVAAGADGNAASGTTLVLTSPITGLNSTGSAAAPITGGADIEAQDALKTRYLQHCWAAPDCGHGDVRERTRAASAPDGGGPRRCAPCAHAARPCLAA